MKTYSLEELEKEKILILGRGNIISKKDIKNFPGKYPIYSSSKVGEGKFGEYDKYMFDESLITWSVDGGGKLFFRNKHKFSITNVTGFIKILNKEFLDYKYLYYYLTYLHSKIKFDWVKKAHPSIIRKEYNKIKIPLKNKQLEIVKKIEEVENNINLLKVSNKKNLEKVEKFSSYIVNKLIHNSSKNIKEIKLKDVIFNVQYGTSKKCGQSGKYPVIRMGNIQNTKINYDSLVYLDDEQEAKKYLLKKNDILFNRTNSPLHVGKTAIFDGKIKSIFAGYLIRVNYNPNKVIPEYLNYYLNSKKIREYGYSVMSTAINQSNINGTKLSNYPFYSIDILEQRKIVTQITIFQKLIEQFLVIQKKISNLLIKFLEIRLKEELNIN